MAEWLLLPAPQNLLAAIMHALVPTEAPYIQALERYEIPEGCGEIGPG